MGEIHLCEVKAPRYSCTMHVLSRSSSPARRSGPRKSTPATCVNSRSEGVERLADVLLAVPLVARRGRDRRRRAGGGGQRDLTGRDDGSGSWGRARTTERRGVAERRSTEDASVYRARVEGSRSGRWEGGRVGRSARRQRRFEVRLGQVGDVRRLDLTQSQQERHANGRAMDDGRTLPTISTPALSLASCCTLLTLLEYTMRNLMGLLDGQVYRNSTRPLTFC